MEDNLYEDKLAGLISKEKYDHKCLQLADQAKDVAERLAMLRDMQEVKKPKEEQCHEHPIVDLYMKSTPNQKRIIMVNLFKKMRFHDRAVVLELL